MALVKYNNNSISAVTSAASVPTGALTLIKTLTASSSATLSFVDGTSDVVLDSTYPIYLFKFINIHPATNNADLGLLASINTGSGYGVATTSTFFEAQHDEADGNTNLTYVTAFDAVQSTGLIKMTGSVDADNDASTSGYLHLFNPSSTTFVKHFYSNFNRMYDYESGTPPQWSINSYVAGYVNTTSAVDAIQFKMDSGNIDSGTIKLYGIKDS